MTSWMTPIWWHASKLNHRGSNGAVTFIKRHEIDAVGLLKPKAVAGIQNRVSSIAFAYVSRAEGVPTVGDISQITAAPPTSVNRRVKRDQIAAQNGANVFARR